MIVFNFGPSYDRDYTFATYLILNIALTDVEISLIIIILICHRSIKLTSEVVEYHSSMKSNMGVDPVIFYLPACYGHPVNRTSHNHRED